MHDIGGGNKRLHGTLDTGHQIIWLLVQKIAIRMRNDQMLKVTVLKFKTWVSFEFGSNPYVYLKEATSEP